MARRLRITLRNELVQALDERVGVRGRNAFIAAALQRALECDRWQAIEQGLSSISDAGHDWDDDPAAWVREQRRVGRADASAARLAGC